MKNHGLMIQVYVDFQPGGYIPRRSSGGHRIATYLRQHDWDIESLDFALYFTLEELQEFARSRITSKTVFIGFSCFYGEWPPLIDLFAKWLKQTYPDVTLIFGGSATPMAHDTSIDYHITGFGELAMLQLLKVLAGNEPRSSLILDPRFIARKKVLSANTHYPAFPMHDLGIYYEDRDYINEHEWMTIESARGCKFKCKFCNFPVIGVKGDYTRNAEEFYKNLQHNYDKHGIKNYYIGDETFNDSTEKIVKFADAVERFDFVPFFAGFVRADLLVSRKQDREHMLRMGFLGQFYGIESTNPETLKIVGKGMHPDKLLPGLLEARDYFKNNGRKIYHSTLSFIAGLPHETMSSLHKTVEWLTTHWRQSDILYFPMEVFLPGAEGEGLLSEISKNIEKYGYFESEVDPIHGSHFHAPNLMNWKNEHMNRQQAGEFVDYFFESNPYLTQNTPIFDLGYLASPQYNIDQILTSGFTDPKIHFTAKIHGRQVVKNYKHRKLS